MKVWELHSDGDKYDNIGVNDEVSLADFIESNVRNRTAAWEPLAIKYIPLHTGEKRKGFANYTNLHCMSSAPIMDQEAIDALYNIMEGSVEILPLLFTEKEFFLINIKDMVDCIDTEKSKPSILFGYEYFILKGEKVKGKQIFSMIGSKGVPCVSDIFRQRVIDRGLKGFVFKLIWDSEDPEAPIRQEQELIELRKNKDEFYKRLLKGNIRTIPESELLGAVRTWMINKYNDKSKSLYKAISALPKPCQYVFAMDIIITEVEEGGFNQFYFNYGKQFGELAEKGFKELRLNNAASVVGKANGIYDEISASIKEDSNIDMDMKSFLDSYKDNPLTILDKEFLNSLGNWGDVCIEYIKFCAYAFGD